MEHLEGHPHAFIKDGIVVNVAAFDGHDFELIDIIRQANGGDLSVCCCDNGAAMIGSIWNSVRFYPPKPYPNWIWSGETIGWAQPIPMPTDAYYEWSQEDNEWKFVRDFEVENE